MYKIEIKNYLNVRSSGLPVREYIFIYVYLYQIQLLLYIIGNKYKWHIVKWHHMFLNDYTLTILLTL